MNTCPECQQLVTPNKVVFPAQGDGYQPPALRELNCTPGCVNNERAVDD